ncbi:MAG: hypothetical protein B1H02_00075 [Candidatus Latescibacteria bacterium 4484_107]|nr:MAG: hypothetical protein B1H02_00075 [Candidatus Latescibacteria bacterium 4484_107]
MLAQSTIAPFRVQVLSGWNGSLGLIEIAPQDGGIAFRLNIAPDFLHMGIEGKIDYRNKFAVMNIGIEPSDGYHRFKDPPLRLHFDIAYKEVLLSRRVRYIQTSQTPFFHQVQKLFEPLAWIFRTDPSNEASIQKVLTSEGTRFVQRIFDLVLVLSMDRLDGKHRPVIVSRLRKRRNGKILIRTTHLKVLKAFVYSEWEVASAQAV